MSVEFIEFDKKDEIKGDIDYQRLISLKAHFNYTILEIQHHAATLVEKIMIEGINNEAKNLEKAYQFRSALENAIKACIKEREQRLAHK